MTKPATDWSMKRFEVARAFSPAAPVRNADLFAGRKAQMDRLVMVVGSDGKHALLYGERGVGKTSLARVLSIAIAPSQVSAFVTCDTTDDFASIWNKILSEIKFLYSKQKFGFGEGSNQVVMSAGEQLGHVTNPDQARTALRMLSDSRGVVIFIDEFDRVRDPATRTAFADLIKIVSDQHLVATLVLIGVADDVGELISEHASIERNIDQIPMPRMSPGELADIVNKALSSVDMKIQSAALGRITMLSQGLPHYTHLLGQSAALVAVDERRVVVTPSNVEAGVRRAIESTQQSIVEKYREATASSQKNLYQEVILACALADRTGQGYFTQPDVREPLSQIVGRPMSIPSYARHLGELCDEKRGPILVKKGQPRRYRYRFANPLMQPYVTMLGLAEGKLQVTD